MYRRSPLPPRTSNSGALLLPGVAFGLLSFSVVANAQEFTGCEASTDCPEGTTCERFNLEELDEEYLSQLSEQDLAALQSGVCVGPETASEGDLEEELRASGACQSDADCENEPCVLFDEETIAGAGFSAEDAAILAEWGQCGETNTTTELDDETLLAYGFCRTDTDCDGESCTPISQEQLNSPEVDPVVREALQGWGTCGDTGGGGAVSAGACGQNSDCPEPAICVEEQCAYPVLQCTSDAQCDDPYECTEALSNSDGTIVMCLPPEQACNADSDCPSTWLCVPTAGQAMFSGWRGLENTCLPPGTIGWLQGELPLVPVTEDGAVADADAESSLPTTPAPDSSSGDSGTGDDSGSVFGDLLNGGGSAQTDDDPAAANGQDGTSAISDLLGPGKKSDSDSSTADSTKQEDSDSEPVEDAQDDSPKAKKADSEPEANDSDSEEDDDGSSAPGCSMTNAAGAGPGLGWLLLGAIGPVLRRRKQRRSGT